MKKVWTFEGGFNLILYDIRGVFMRKFKGLSLFASAGIAEMNLKKCGISKNTIKSKIYLDFLLKTCYCCLATHQTTFYF